MKFFLAMLCLCLSAADGQTIGRLKNGVSIEVIGVSEYRSAGKAWWTADGAPLAQPPYQRIDAELLANPASREIAVRINSNVDGSTEAAAVSFRNVPWSSVRDAAGRGMQQISAAVFTIQPESDLATLHVDVAAGPWKSITRSDAGGIGVQATGDRTLACSQPISKNGETHYVMTQTGVNDNNIQSRLTATDKAGKLQPVWMRRLDGVGTLSCAEFFVKLPLSSIKELNCEERPYDQWIEFRNIATKPGQQTKVEIVTSDQK